MQVTELEILEDFVRENDELDRLEAMAGVFNSFEVLGIVRRELRHSDFLAYPLDPQENHALGDAFVKRLLKKACQRGSGTGSSVSAIELDTIDFDELEVRREWRNIDILLRLDTPKHRLIVAIENKIDTSEHSEQLQRYQRLLSEEFSGWKTLCLYLTIDREIPSDASFIPIDYSLVAALLESLLNSPVVSPPSAARALIEQYCQTVRRHFMAESDIADLCNKIYKKHKKALDLIFRYIPDDQGRIRDLLSGLVRENKNLVLDNPDKLEKRYLRFASKGLEVPALSSGVGWSGSGRMLLFEFSMLKDSLKLRLIIGPGPEKVRRKLFELALSGKCQLLKPYSKTLNEKWNGIFGRNFLSSSDYEDGNEDQMEQKIRQRWVEFVDKELPAICQAIETMGLEK
jgi:hypothetical protein